MATKAEVALRADMNDQTVWPTVVVVGILGLTMLMLALPLFTVAGTATVAHYLAGH